MHIAIGPDREDSLGAGIGQNDVAELIDGHHRIGQPGQNFAQLIAFHGRAADADFGGGAGHFQLLGPLGKLDQPRPDTSQQLAPGMILLAERDGVEGRLVVQIGPFQPAQVVDVLAGGSGRLGRLHHHDADGEQRQRHAAREHHETANPAHRRKRRLHDPGRAQGRAQRRQGGRRQELSNASIGHAHCLCCARRLCRSRQTTRDETAQYRAPPARQRASAERQSTANLG
jgi:hypothetical protein